MDWLTVNDILAFIKELKDQGMTLEEIRKLPIYLGNDTELNGIHTGWGLCFIDSNGTDETSKYYTEMINEDNFNNVELNGKAILIS
jgi:DNA-binding transcriptional MerR regulator